MLHKRFFHQIEKLEDMAFYLTRCTLSASFVCNFMNYLPFQESLLQYLNPKNFKITVPGQGV